MLKPFGTRTHRSEDELADEKGDGTVKVVKPSRGGKVVM
jgi:hypothetical protein